MISRVNGFICLTEQARQRAAAGYDPVRPEAGKVTEVAANPGIETTRILAICSHHSQPPARVRRARTSACTRPGRSSMRLRVTRARTSVFLA